MRLIVFVLGFEGIAAFGVSFYFRVIKLEKTNRNKKLLRILIS